MNIIDIDSNNRKNFTELSKEISYALRHAPWEYELEMDENGFVPLLQLISSINESGHYNRGIFDSDIEYIIETSEKKRFEIVDGKIRALYGHSIPMFIKKDEGIPPDVLYHGTTDRAYPEIEKNGLLPMARQYVHMSVDTKMANQVAKRRYGGTVILKIDAKAAVADGIKFYVGNDMVWLANAIPPKYISILEDA